MPAASSACCRFRRLETRASWPASNRFTYSPRRLLFRQGPRRSNQGPRGPWTLNCAHMGSLLPKAVVLHLTVHLHHRHLGIPQVLPDLAGVPGRLASCRSLCPNQTGKPQTAPFGALFLCKSPVANFFQELCYAPAGQTLSRRALIAAGHLSISDEDSWPAPIGWSGLNVSALSA